MIDRETLPYRPAVGIMLLNSEGKVLVGQRLDSSIEAWQMPQGGLDPGEEVIDGAMRELWEETGVEQRHVELIARCPVELYYDLPEDLLGKVWNGKWRGQRQHWLLCRFTGTDADVNIETSEPEFRAWKWAEPSELPTMIVPFKKELYAKVLDAFAEWLR